MSNRSRLRRRWMKLLRQDQRHLKLCGFGAPYPRRNYCGWRALSRMEDRMRFGERYWWYTRRSFLGW